MNRHSPAVAKQGGMAIISALLIAAVVAVIAAGLLTRQRVFTRSLEAELKNCQSQRTSSEDGVRLTKAVAQMREEILELNQALKMAYDSPVRGDSEEIRRLHEQVWHLTAAVNALHDSRSWRITKPLRRLYSLVTGR